MAVLAPNFIPDNADLSNDAEADAFSTSLAAQAMAWGFVLGFDHANGGLWHNDTSTLERFKDACAARPSLTGAEVLDALTQ